MLEPTVLHNVLLFVQRREVLLVYSRFKHEVDSFTCASGAYVDYIK